METEINYTSENFIKDIIMKTFSIIHNDGPILIEGKEVSIQEMADYVYDNLKNNNESGDEDFPAYILMPENNETHAYMLYSVTKDDGGLLKADYRRSSAFTVYCHIVNITKHDDHYTHDIKVDNEKVNHIRWDHLIPTTVWRFLRTNASFIDFPANREIIDIALNDVNRSKLSELLRLHIMEDGEMHGLPSKKIEPFASINSKLIELHHQLMKYI